MPPKKPIEEPKQEMTATVIINGHDHMITYVDYDDLQNKIDKIKSQK